MRRDKSHIMEEQNIKVVELFAGVGGFRLGLEGWQQKTASSRYTESFESPYKVIWSNQWEPQTKTQYASMVYENRWGKGNHSNQDIAAVDVNEIPDHDLLVGGFPCQDYSVATTSKNAKGLIGKKGVLWWSIHKILDEKINKPKYLFLENVDRLLISPSKQRGRDFAIILKSLNDLGYIAEWRVINAAEYGMPQRRRRIFILAYHKTSPLYQSIKEIKGQKWILSEGTLANAFPSSTESGSDLSNQFELKEDIVEISNNFNKECKKGIFHNTGIIINGNVTTIKTVPVYNEEYTLLKDVVYKGNIPKEFYINGDLERWEYLKGSKKEIRKSSQGFEYNYSEGKMSFPDALDKASRTIITGEGGKAASRFKHVIKTNDGLRRLTPIELERLNMFPDNHTKLEGITDSKRAFFMGNALVVGAIEKIGIALKEQIAHELTLQY
jgi:DNA (cytosine-5)-methyltransferase 1